MVQFAHPANQVPALNVISMLETPAQHVHNAHQIYLDYLWAIIVFVKMDIMTQDLHFVLSAQQFAFYALQPLAVNLVQQIYIGN